MATNFEHYKEEILKIVEANQNDLAKANGKLVGCNEVDCAECDFERGKAGISCVLATFEWLCTEYKPQPKLTKKERLFCELVETGWIASDKDGKCRWYFGKKPFKTNEYWHNNSANQSEMHMLPCEFSFIKFEDTEPWTVEDLLKLEVEE